MATENLLMRAVEQGGDRQQLHETIRVAAIAAGRKIKEEGADCDLLERLAEDPSFPLNEEEIKQHLDPKSFTGMARKQTKVFLNSTVRKAMEQYGDLPDADVKIEL